MKNNQLINSIEKTLNSIINIINSDINEFNIDLWKKEKSKQSSSVLSRKLGLNDSLYNEFETALYQFEQYNDDPKKSKIACFRISLWLETVCKKLNLPFSIEESISNEQLAIKQVRALELLIRDVVNENLGGSQNVLLKLQELFKQDIVDKWIKSADETGVLSGTTFSELSNIFLDKDIFKSIEELVENSNLKLSKNNRDSLRYILEDIRLIRNSIAHNKKISNVQIDALNAYYLEIANLITESKSNTINPEAYLDLDMANLEEFLSSLKQDNKIISISVDEIKNNVKDVKKDTASIRKKTSLLVLVISLILIITAAILYLVFNQNSNTNEITNDLKVVKDVVTKSGGRVIDASSYIELKHNLNNQLTSKEEAAVILSSMFNNFPNESINEINEIYAYPRFDYKNFNNSQLINELLWLKEFIKKNKNQELNSQYAILRIDEMLRIMKLTYCNIMPGGGNKNSSKLPLEKRFIIINEVVFEIDQILKNIPLKDVKSIRVIFYSQILNSFVDNEIGVKNGNSQIFYDNLKKSENFQIALKLFESNLVNKNGESLFLDVFGEKISFKDVKNWQQFDNFLSSIEINFSNWKSSGKNFVDYTLFE
jgi:hypothetical protein